MANRVILQNWVPKRRRRGWAAWRSLQEQLVLERIDIFAPGRKNSQELYCLGAQDLCNIYLEAITLWKRGGPLAVILRRIPTHRAEVSADANIRLERCVGHPTLLYRPLAGLGEAEPILTRH